MSELDPCLCHSVYKSHVMCITMYKNAAILLILAQPKPFPRIFITLMKYVRVYT